MTTVFVRWRILRSVEMQIGVSDVSLHPNLQRGLRSFKLNCCFTQRKPAACTFRVQLSKRVAGRRGDQWRCKASFTPAPVAFSEARELILQGQEKFNSGDRMGALKLFEESLDKGGSKEERQAALFNATAVHASFGDVELAQITLREGINSGLLFESALRDQDNPLLVRMQVSPQISIQLRKFAEACKRVRAAVQPDRKGGPDSRTLGIPGALAGGTLASARGLLGTDMSDRLKTDVSGIDASIGGIIRRVLVVLALGTGFGVALFYLGLKYAFPEM